MCNIRILMAFVLSASSLSSCVEIQGPKSDIIPAEQVLSSVSISTPSVLMQVDENLQLGLSATSMLGTDIPVNSREVIWWSADPDLVSVDSTGMLQGKAKTNIAVSIVASWQYLGITRTDTIPVSVTTDRFDITGVRLVSVDSNKIGGGDLVGRVPPRVRIDGLVGDNVELRGILMHLVVPEPIVAEYSPNAGENLEGVYLITNPKYYTGPILIKAAGTVYGVPVEDSIQWMGLHTFAHMDFLNETEDGDVFSIGYRDDVGVVEMFSQPCALFLLFNVTSQTVDLILDDSTAASDCAEDPDPQIQFFYSTGNAYDVLPGTIIVRKFSSEGVINWHLRNSETGQVYPRARGAILTKLP